MVELFETFVRFGGNLRKTLAHVYENGPHFPDFDDPEFQRSVPPGYICDKPVRMLKRGGVYCPSRIAMVNMITNALYIGHWMHKDRVVQWNNHPAIVSEELFYRAFNYLSPYTLTGEPNQYMPAFQRERSKEDRNEAKPIYKGLIGTYYEGEWRQAVACWSPSMQAYAYCAKRNDLATNQYSLWSRRCDYFDQVITEMMQNKLRSTFDSQVWANVVASAEEDFDTERRNLTTQLQSVTQKMQAIITKYELCSSSQYASSPTTGIPKLRARTRPLAEEARDSGASCTAPGSLDAVGATSRKCAGKLGSDESERPARRRSCIHCSHCGHADRQAPGRRCGNSVA